MNHKIWEWDIMLVVLYWDVWLWEMTFAQDSASGGHAVHKSSAANPGMLCVAGSCCPLLSSPINSLIFFSVCIFRAVWYMIHTGRWYHSSFMCLSLCPTCSLDHQETLYMTLVEDGKKNLNITQLCDTLTFAGFETIEPHGTGWNQLPKAPLSGHYDSQEFVVLIRGKIVSEFDICRLAVGGWTGGSSWQDSQELGWLQSLHPCFMHRWVVCKPGCVEYCCMWCEMFCKNCDTNSSNVLLMHQIDFQLYYPGQVLDVLFSDCSILHWEPFCSSFLEHLSFLQ